MKKTLHINVADKVATYQKRDGVIVCGNSDYEVKFLFDEEWAEHEEKTARFIWNGRYTDVDFTGDTCPVPIITGAILVEVGAYAGNLSTTTSALVPALRSVLCGGEPPTDGDAEFTSAAKAAAERAEAAADRAEAAGEGPTPTGIDLSALDTEGKIVENYADGSTKTTTFEFDANGNPVKITDSDGNETVLTW